MKKTFLFTVICVFSFLLVSAQQTDFFDIQKHLRKNNPITLAPGKQVAPQILKMNKLALVNNSITSFFAFPGQLKQIFVCPNGDKVYTSPQFHMPVIVPDMSAFNMPNAYQTDGIYNIPNAGVPPGFRSLIQ